MTEVKQCMTSMRLNLNDDKTEIIYFGSQQQLVKTSKLQLMLME